MGAAIPFRVAKEAFEMDAALVKAAARVGEGGSGIGKESSETSARSSGRPVAAAWETWLQYSNRILRPRRRQPQPKAAAPPHRKRNVDVIHPGARSRHDQLARPPLRSRRRCPRGRASRVPADLPAAGLGRARCGGDLGDAIGRHARGARQGRHRCARRGRHRHHEPARDHGAVGPRIRSARRPRHRLAGPPHGAALRRAARRGPRAR